MWAGVGATPHVSRPGVDLAWPPRPPAGGIFVAVSRWHSRQRGTERRPHRWRRSMHWHGSLSLPVLNHHNDRPRGLAFNRLDLAGPEFPARRLSRQGRAASAVAAPTSSKPEKNCTNIPTEIPPYPTYLSGLEVTVKSPMGGPPNMAHARVVLADE